MRHHEAASVGGVVDPARPRRGQRPRLQALLILLLLAAPVQAAGKLQLPDAGDVLRVLSLRDHNTRVVVIGVGALGLAAGMIGTFLLLRKRALLGDALSHATLPGIGIAFLFMVAIGGEGKSLPGLLTGATVAGLLGVLAILFIRRFSKLKEDAALGIVLSVFFGIGVAVQGIIVKSSRGGTAGLETFIYGKTASMVASDAWTIAIAALVIALLCVLLLKEWTLLCFDAPFASAQGWPVKWLDLLLMAAVTAVTVIGLQAVGLILMIALLIIPPAAARFWTERLLPMLVFAAVIGAASGASGAIASALFDKLPAGAVIVLMASLAFVVSMFFGRSRGLLVRWAAHRELTRRIAEQHLLRALFERMEAAGAEIPTDQPLAELLRDRSWAPGQLLRIASRAAREGLVIELPGQRIRLSDEGLAEARRLVRNHRLWEIYLIAHADVAPSHVDRDADAIEHVLGQSMVRKLELLLADQQRREKPLPASPHPVR